jgi:ring-1,2-phenylacetyl-CoA epoxidase subunit PaaC
VVRPRADRRGRHRASATWRSTSSARRARCSPAPASSKASSAARRHDEDQLAFLRDERDFRNCTLVELPRGDFAVTMLRNCAVAIFLELLWQRLEGSSDGELAAIAGKAVKEARYHREHAADWVVRLGDGTEESAARLKAALDLLWPYFAEIFEADAVDAEADAARLGPRWADLRDDWRAGFAAVLSAAGLSLPAERAFRSTGKTGRHSEHLGYVLAEMQHLQRSFPGGVW